MVDCAVEQARCQRPACWKRGCKKGELGRPLLGQRPVAAQCIHSEACCLFWCSAAVFVCAAGSGGGISFEVQFPVRTLSLCVFYLGTLCLRQTLDCKRSNAIMVSSTAFSSALVQGPPREFKERVAAPIRQSVRKIRSQNDSEYFLC